MSENAKLQALNAAMDQAGFARPDGSRMMICANATPFTEHGAVDLERLQSHTEAMAAAGVDGFAPAGTTGEFVYLTDEERLQIYATVIRGAGDKAVLPCVWSPTPGGAIRLARSAVDMGAAGVFLPPPIYQPISADAIVRWYAAVRDAVDVPVLAYHHPRTHNTITPEIYEKLILEVGLNGMKDSSGDATRDRQLALRFPGLLFAGGDHLAGTSDEEIGPIRGHISRMANAAPELAAKIAHGEPVHAEWQRFCAEWGPLGLLGMKQRLGFGCRAPIA